MISIQNWKAIIIGAGPAGLFAAIRLAEVTQVTAGISEPGERGGILILERKEKPGRKLLLSGSGQCNLTHAGPVADFLDHYGGGAKAQSAARFLKPALYNFDNQKLLTWFKARGIQFETEENGKIFPSDLRASSILKVLQDEAQNLAINIKTSSRVSGISSSSNGFLVQTEGQDPPYSAPVICIAAGGASYPGTGSTGDGYTLAAALGHRIVPPRPALAPVFIRDFTLKSLAGLSFHNAGLTILRGGKRILAATGDLLITHEGLSGPLILDSSRYINPGDTLELNFTHASMEEFRAFLDAELLANPRRLVRTALTTISGLGLTKNMADLFCEFANITQETTGAILPRAKREALCRLACAQLFTVDRLGSLETAMVTAGGVDLAEVNPRTMESRLVPGLFFAGEVLDIDGDTGGYNLQAAFSTGALAASGISQKIVV